jgi:hypothetical protein
VGRLGSAPTVSGQSRFRSSLWSYAYLVLRRVVALIVLLGRSREAKETEILVLRHQLGVLRRGYPRPRLQPADRAWPPRDGFVMLLSAGSGHALSEHRRVFRNAEKCG